MNTINLNGIIRGATLQVVPRKTTGVFYMVKNNKAVARTSFIGNFDQLMAKRYAGLKAFWNVTEEEFLRSVLN